MLHHNTTSTISLLNIFNNYNSTIVFISTATTIHVKLFKTINISIQLLFKLPIDEMYEYLHVIWITSDHMHQSKVVI